LDLSSTIILVIFLLLAEGFFSGSELAIVSISRIKLKHLAENGVKYALTLEKLLQYPERIFGATSVGTNLCVFAASAVVTAFMVNAIGDGADFYSFLVMGPLTLILGEIAPKMVFRNNTEAVVPYITRPLSFSLWLFRPILAVTTAVSRIVLKFVLRQTEIPASLISREEILLLTKMSEKKLELDHDEKKMIHRIFEFKTSDVESAMQPLINIVAVSSNSTLEQARERIAETGYSRLPVFHDRIYNIMGIISAFDIMRQSDRAKPVSKVMSPAYYVPTTKKNSQLMKEMQDTGVAMSVVVDEYGAATGLVTLEDLLEEIVGEIEDEYDKPVKSYESLGGGRYIIDAAMEIDGINDELGLDLPTGDYETLGGFLNESLERIPRKRERLGIGKYLITILDATARKVKSVELIDLDRERDETKPPSENREPSS